MRDQDLLRIAAQSESPEQAAQMIAHHQAVPGNWWAGAVLVLPTAPWGSGLSR
jgi:hypothetical protein